MRRFVSFLILLCLLFLAGAWYLLNQPLHWQGEAKEFTLPAGSNIRHAARILALEGVPVNQPLLVWYARLTRRADQIKAGSYRVENGTTVPAILDRMVRGDFVEYSLTIVEGWNFRQVMQAIAQNEALENDLAGLRDAELLQQLGIAEAHPEGLFAPETYHFPKGSKASFILKQAYKIQQQRLMQVWEKRMPDLPLNSPYEALILASIVEKETGHTQDRDRVAAVFVNRLRKGMLLQTDPSVIYGMGDKYKGHIGAKGLATDTPYNTYTRAGLPPTPIAMPGSAALQSTLNPALSEDLFFVSRGDGTSEFSVTLDEHNRAVNKYIRGVASGKAPPKGK